jgi:predicted amidohydrolase YtcJ
MKKTRLLVAAAVVIISVSIVLYLLLMRDFAHEKETIYFNGTILTMEDSQPVVGAVLVRDGIIIAAGGKDEIMKRKAPGTVLADLGGKTMMPGFVDPHTHVDISAFLFDMLDLSGFRHKTNKDVWAYLEESVKKYPKGEWIVCKGLDPILTADIKTPHITYLDKIAPDNPVVITAQTLHSYWVNTKAFQASGITAATPDPSKSSFYEKDRDGKLTGFIAEQEAFSPVRQALLKATSTKKLVGRVDSTLADYAKKGNTTVVSAGLTSEDNTILRLYGHLSGGKPAFLNQLLALVGMFPERSPRPRHFIYIRDTMEQQLPSGQNNGDDFCKIIGVKIWYDGSPYTGSMYLREPYVNSELTSRELHIRPGDSGYALLTKNEIVEKIKKYNKLRWQISVHAQGDRANAETMAAFEEAAKTMDITPYRHRIEHCLLMDKNLLPVFKHLNMTPSFHVNHIYYYGKALNDSIIGRERAGLVLPVKSAAGQGLNFTIHADQPMFASEPFSLVSTAVTRRTREGMTLGAGEAITVLQALKALTTMAAWQIGFEDKLGSIKAGKYADFVVLDRNPLEMPVEKIRDIRVLKTIVNGNSVNFQQ